MAYCSFAYASSSGYLINDSSEYVRWTVDDDGNLEIFGNTYMPSYYDDNIVDSWWPNKQITSAWIHSGILNVSEYAFKNSSLKSITLPSTLTYIDPYAFSNSSLESMMFHSRFTTIGEYAFSSCSKLKSLEIRNGVTKIYDCAFKECPSLESIFVRHDNPCFCAVNNVLYSKDKTTLIKYPSGSSATSFTIPEGVKVISPCAFDYSSNLESITVASTVETIASGAFAHCDNLKTVIFLGNAPSINYVPQSPIYHETDGMFSGDNLTAYYPIYDSTWNTFVNSGYGGTVVWKNDPEKYLQYWNTLTLPDSLLEIHEYAFSNLACQAVIIPSNCQRIDQYAFSNCRFLRYVKVSQNTIIDSHAFDGCESYIIDRYGSP